MKRFIVGLMFSAFSLAAFAEVSAFTDDEAYSYLKPDNDVVYTNVVKAILVNEAEASLQQNKTAMGFDLTPHTVKKIVGDFEKNEIVATDNYRNNAVRIKGVIKSVGLDALKNGVITVSGDKSFAGNLIASVDKSAGWVRKAAKGDEIDMICNVSGYMMMNVTAKCDSALNVAEQIVKNEYGISEKYELPKTVAGAGLAYTIKTNTDKLSKFCGSSGEKCFKKLMAELDSNELKQPKPDARFTMWVKKLPDPTAQR